MNFEPSVRVDGTHLNGLIHVYTPTATLSNPNPEGQIIFKADMKDIQTFTKEQLDELVLEIEAVKEKIGEVELQVFPPVTPPPIDTNTPVTGP